MLGAWAEATSRVEIGALVTCNSYRNPALLAKMASTVDVLSHGRLDFGIGAGWYEHEYNAYGYPYPDGPERLRMLREALQIIHAMWTDDYATFEGKYYQVRGAINEPKGVQKPHIPMWIGGGGEKVTLKLVAQYGDACNTNGFDPQHYQHKFGVLRQHCEDVGRDYNSIIKSGSVSFYVISPGDDPEEVTRSLRKRMAEVQKRDMTLEDLRRGTLVGTPQECIDALGKLVEQGGVDYFIVTLQDIVRLEQLQRFAEEVLPAFRGQAVSAK